MDHSASFNYFQFILITLFLAHCHPSLNFLLFLHLVHADTFSPQNFFSFPSNSLDDFNLSISSQSFKPCFVYFNLRKFRSIFTLKLFNLMGDKKLKRSAKKSSKNCRRSNTAMLAYWLTQIMTRVISTVSLLVIAISLLPFQQKADSFNACVQELELSGRSSSSAVSSCNGGK